MSKVVRLPTSRFSTPPSSQDLARIPLARHGEYQLSPKEVVKTRQFIYGINKDGIRRYRTILEGGILMVWRIK
jgi:hypothetical protein